MKKIVWLASYPKSGSTWMRVLFCNFRADSTEPVPFNQLGNIPLVASRELFDTISGIDSIDLTVAEINAVRPEVYREYAQQHSAPVLFKVHDQYTSDLNGNPIFPIDSSIGTLVIVRNPLDVACSYAHHNKESIDRTVLRMNDAEEKYCFESDRGFSQLVQHIGTWSEHIESWIDNPDIPHLVIKYEDLHANPHDTFSEALQFTLLPNDKSTITRAIENSKFSKLRQQEIISGFHGQRGEKWRFFRKGRVSAWKEELTAKQVEQIVKDHHQVMERLGYETDISVLHTQLKAS